MNAAMDAAAIRGDWLGSIVDGRYPLLEWLGASEQSAVFLTELPGEPRGRAAIKLVAADGREAQARIDAWSAARELSHPNLMRLIDAGRCLFDDTEFVFAVMELADEVLAKVLAERPLTAVEAGEMLGPIVDALGYLHGMGLAHGHLKPTNIMVVDDRLKLSADSIQSAGEAGWHLPGQQIYEAPEAGAGTVSAAADLWALGVTLVVSLTQRPPEWDGSPDSEPVVPESVAEPFAGIARLCLRVDPARRFTLEQVKARLVPAQPPARPPAEEPGKPVGKTGVEQEKKPSAMPRRLALAATLLLVAAGGGIFYLRSNGAQPTATEQTQQAFPDAAPVTVESVPAATPPVDTSPEGKQRSTGDTSATRADRKPPAVAAAAKAPDKTVRGIDRAAQEQANPEAAASSIENVPPSPRLLPVRGSVAYQVLPDVLPEAISSIHGKVTVGIQVEVDANGNVTEAKIASPVTSKYFAEAALDAARQWRFKPSQLEGQPVASDWILQFKFTPAGINVTPGAGAR